MDRKSRPKTILKAIGIIIAILLILAVGIFAMRSKLIAMLLTKVPGNDDLYSPEQTEALLDSPLQGKTIAFLGSSVTEGSTSLGDSFVEYLEKRDGIVPIKEAVSGTTLVEEGEEDSQSYIARLLTMDTSQVLDCMVVQLSTNDATQNKPLGTVSDETQLEKFDVSTVAGAIEYIIVYTEENWGCPIVFYTGTRYDSDQYAQMVSLLLEIQEKWSITVLDLWNDAEMNAVSEEDYSLYMMPDGIHPSRAGYREWWLPEFEDCLTELLCSPQA